MTGGVRVAALLAFAAITFLVESDLVRAAALGLALALVMSYLVGTSKGDRETDTARNLAALAAIGLMLTAGSLVFADIPDNLRGRWIAAVAIAGALFLFALWAWSRMRRDDKPHPPS